jgi:hypothetical protein
MRSAVHEIATEDSETSTAEVIFLYAPGRVAEAGSGDISEDKRPLVRNLRCLFDTNEFEILAVCLQCSLRPSWNCLTG